MPDDWLQVGVVGVGLIGRRHIGVLADISDRGARSRFEHLFSPQRMVALTEAVYLSVRRPTSRERTGVRRSPAGEALGLGGLAFGR